MQCMQLSPLQCHLQKITTKGMSMMNNSIHYEDIDEVNTLTEKLLACAFYAYVHLYPLTVNASVGSAMFSVCCFSRS